MKPGYELTEANITAQVVEIQATLNRLLTNVSARQLNWQPDAGRSWSIGQCLDHVTRTADIYSKPIGDAVTAAPLSAATAARPKLLGRAFIRFIEPPVRVKTPAPGSAHPASMFDPAPLRSDFERSLADLQSLAMRR